MQSIIKKMSEEDIKDFVDIGCNAYSGFDINATDEKEKMGEKFKRLQKEHPLANLYGLYREDKMLGGMILFDYYMNFNGTKINAGGVGFVAVDLLHKKEKVAKELITYFLEHYKNKETYMTLLYPFRPDFYKKMGFGYGTKMNQHKVKPSSLPIGDSKKNIEFLTIEDSEEILNCYSRYTDRTHGMIDKYLKDIEVMFKNPKVKIVGFKKENSIEGYIVFEFKKDNKGRFLLNDILIHEFIYESREALSQLMTFLNTQNDQIRHIIFNTQDENFHHLLIDPRNDSDNLIPSVYHESNAQGVGLMYRVTDIKRMFKSLNSHKFNNVDLNLKLNVIDSFFKENESSTIIHFNKGIAEIKEEDIYDVEITMDIADFSSMFLGCINFKSLYNYNLANISDTNYIETINKLFKTDEKPICMTKF